MQEFREGGFLQEVNRLFFHPVGLALAINVDAKGEPESLAFILDFREDPEGGYYATDEEWLEECQSKASNVLTERDRRRSARKRFFGGSSVQPLAWREPEACRNGFPIEGPAPEPTDDKR